jgi:two-component system chemotaxis response regulator CheB
MGSDGVVGLHKVREAGGTVLAQDEGSSVVFGMPRDAVAAGVVNAVLGVEQIAPRLVALARET